MSQIQMFQDSHLNKTYKIIQERRKKSVITLGELKVTNKGKGKLKHKTRKLADIP